MSLKPIRADWKHIGKSQKNCLTSIDDVLQSDKVEQTFKKNSKKA